MSARTTLRPARPSLDEGCAYARYLDEAADGFFGFMLGRRAHEIIARAFLEPGHDLSFENVTFAERGGRVVGMVSVYTAEQHRRSPNDTLARSAGPLHLRHRLVSTLFAPLIRIIESTNDGDFYVQALAVDEDVRGTGVASRLLDTASERARAFGSGRLALDVAASNHHARAVDERRGWTVESRWPRRFAIPVLTFLRMTRHL